MKDKIPFYDIVNKFFVGTVFLFLFVILSIDKIPYDEMYNRYSVVLKDWAGIITAALFISVYEIGFIINRLSSLILGPILVNTKLWPKDNYRIDVSEIKKSNDTFTAMITELVLIRSHILIYFILTIVALVYKKWLFAIVFILLIVIFVLSGKKHNARINIIRKDYAERKEKNETGN